MSFIKCYECNHQVSDKASACPNCGSPVEMGQVFDQTVARDPLLHKKSDAVYTIILWLFGLGIICILFTGGLGRAVWFLWGILWGIPYLALFVMGLAELIAGIRKVSKKEKNDELSLGKFIMFAVLFLGLAYQSYASFKYAVTGEGKPPTLNLGSGEYSRR
jgi:hypothetical protein